MRNKALLIFVTFLFLFAMIVPQMIMAQDGRGMSKWEYYEQLCRARGETPRLAKPSGYNDRKEGLLDVGKVRLGIQNNNLLGYSRQLITFEFPKGSGITYNWCQSLIVAGKLGGTKRISNGTLGCYGGENEEHYEPLGGYDSGVGDNGLAMSNKPDSWPASWPSDVGPIGSLGFPGVYEDGEVAATAEAYWVAADDLPDCKQPTPLHIRTYGRALQFSSVLAEDFIVFKFYVENTGTETIEDCYVGVHTDMDSPEEGNGEWMDDFAKFISVEEDSVLGNFLYLWDGDDQSEGFIEKGVAWQGLKMLETPKGEDGEELGLTTLVCETYDDFYALPNQQSVYDWMAKGIDPVDNVAPHSTDWTETENTYGPDVTSMHGSGPFDLAPGQRVVFTFANVFGTNKADLMANAQLCQTVYDFNYKTANPPPAPNVRAVVKDQQVTLYWDAEPTESAIDGFTGTNAFEGYKIYKSTDRGLTWGEPITNTYGALVNYVPIAQCDLINGIEGPSTTNPYFDLGSETGLFHSYTDRNLKNGVEYWYAVCAYDHDDTFEGIIPVPPMENPRLSNADYEGDHVVRVIPQAGAAGYDASTAGVSDVTHVSGVSGGSVSVEVVDPSLVVPGTYQVSFEMDDAQGTLVRVKLNGETVMGPVPVMPPDAESTDGMPAFNGLRIAAVDAPAGIDEDATGAVTGDNLALGYWDYENPAGSGMTDDYEVRFTEGGSIAWQYSSPYGPVQVPYEIWNITDGQQINSDVYDRGDQSFDIANNDYIMPHNTAYDANNYVSAWPDDYNYYFRFSTGSTFSVGDVYRIITFKPFSTDDVYEFTATGASMALTEGDLDDITVVPNPYVVTSAYEYSQTMWVKELQFHHLPEECTIRIFTISGELVQILHHEPGSAGYRGPAVEAWNLWTYNDQEVAFGVYIFHVEAEGVGEKVGKFCIIK